MSTATAIFTAWSAGIFAVIHAVSRTPLGESPAWARILPVLPLLLGGISGPTVVPVVAEHLPWLSDIDTLGAIFLGIGAGAVAASGHSAHRQTIRGMDRRIGHRGEGRGGKSDSSSTLNNDGFNATGGERRD